MSAINTVSQTPVQYPQSTNNNTKTAPTASAPKTTYEQGQGGNGVVINIYNPVGTKNGGTEPAAPTPPAQPQNTSVPFPAAQKLDKTQTDTEKPKTPEKKKDDKPKVPLTDDYIKTLENYLNNPNADLRAQGTQEILKRFKEDKARANDIALTNLLNKSLQDPSQNVRLVALSALQGNYATGDKLTYQILQKMQNSKDKYNLDASSAATILLQRAGQNLNVSTSSSTDQANNKQQNSQQGQNLNLVAK